MDQPFKRYRNNTSPHYDLDLQLSTQIFLYDTLAHDDPSPTQSLVTNTFSASGSEDICRTNIHYYFEPFL